MTDYPHTFQKYRPGTFFLKGLQFGISNLNYHAMNEYGEYEAYLAFSNPLNYKKDLLLIEQEAEKLRLAHCTVINKKVSSPFFDILNMYAYYGQKFLDKEELLELRRVQSDTIAFQKMIQYLTQNKHVSSEQILNELYF